MNPDTRCFEKETEATPEEWIRFAVGEIIKVKGIEMEIRKITNRSLVVRPVGQKIRGDKSLKVHNPAFPEVRPEPLFVPIAQ